MRHLPRTGWSARRKLGALGAVGSLAAILLLATAPAALAHATVVSTSPGDGSVLARQPADVSVTFDQPVGIIAGSLRVYTPGGQQAGRGAVTHTAAQTIEIGLANALPHGTFTAAWRVISADSHEVEGAFTFSIGSPSAHVGISAPTVNLAVVDGYATIRGLTYGFYVILAGAVAFLIICWPEGARRKGVNRLIGVGWAGMLVATLLSLLFQGAYGVGQGLGALFNAGLVHSTLHSRLGLALQIREALATAATIAVTAILPRLPAAGARARAAIGTAWVALTMGLAATWASFDHSSTGSLVPLAMASDIVHLTAAAIWCGGLVMLVAFVLRGSATAPAASTAIAVRRFSSAAFGCVVAIIVTGLYQAWREDGLNVNVYIGTTYGWLLIGKTAGVICLIGLGYLARHFIGTGLPRVAMVRSRLAAVRTAVAAALMSAAGGVAEEADTPAAMPAVASATAAAVPVTAASAPAGAAKASAVSGSRTVPVRSQMAATGLSGASAGPPDQAPPDRVPAGEPDIPLSKLRRSVLVEAILVTVILALSAILVNTATGREAFSQPASATVQFSTAGGQPDQLHAIVAPAVLGPNAVDIFLSTPHGKPFTAAEVDASLFFPARQIGPLPVKLALAGPGHYHATQAVAITISGQWQLRVTVRSDAFDETTVTIPVTVF